MSVQLPLVTREEIRIKDAASAASSEAINCVLDAMKETDIGIKELAERTGASPSFLNRLFTLDDAGKKSTSSERLFAVSLMGAMFEALGYNMYMWIQKKDEEK